MSIETKKEILLQKNEVFEQDFQVNLIDSCRVGDGIVRLTSQEIDFYSKAFDLTKQDISCFIPASGSGSRMFKFLFEWIKNGDSSSELFDFFESIQDFPFYDNLIEKIDLTEETNKMKFAELILREFSVLPKGLIPFHKNGKGVSTAFQDQLIQAKLFFGEKVKVHFTIQKDYEQKIKENINFKEESNVSFSYQKEATNAFCYDYEGVVVMDGKAYLKRPAGHGALLENLNDLVGDIFVIKNIDNIQHNTKSEDTGKTWKTAIGLLCVFKKELKNLSENFSVEKLIELNNKFQFIPKSVIHDVNQTDLERYGKRPTRVAGMVVNEGEPGGGPFWISGKNGISNQIVEKAQIKESPLQEKIVQKSSHFNPVFIVASKTDVFGNRLNLIDFRDDSKFFVVKKTHEGEEIIYRELPGLWNGGMSDWNTIFLEIPSAVFSPVKSILDLNKPAHKKS